MDEKVKNLKGSKSRDEFKLAHKQMDRRFYALDIDFVYVEKFPLPSIVAILDYKKDSNDKLRFSEVIAFNDFVFRGIDCFIVEGNFQTGPIVVKKYCYGDHRPDPPIIKFGKVNRVLKNSEDFERWEKALRDSYKRKFYI